MNLHSILQARSRIQGQIALTPCHRSSTLSQMLGCELYIKFENQQFTASFKERGALHCLLCLSQAQLDKGVVTMSAGNHAQALAYHGARLGVSTVIVMPRSTPNTKVEQTRVHGAEVHLHGAEFDETMAYTMVLAQERDLTVVHPYNDERVMAGQGTVGLEIVEQVPAPDCVVVPIGGGGLISGVATAVKGRVPECRVVGVQMERFSAVHDAFNGVLTPSAKRTTVAEGIAVKSPGDLTLPVIHELVDEVVTVSEDEVENALFALLEIEKTVSEGAGAAALAALTANAEAYQGQRVVIILSGGNVDMMVLSSLLQRGLVRSRRLVRLEVEVPDVPGALAKLTELIGALDSNIIDISQQSAFGSSSARATMVELVLQMRGEEQIGQVISSLADAGYEAQLA